MRSLLCDGHQSQAEKNLSIMLGGPISTYVTPGRDRAIKTLIGVREKVLENYSKTELKEIAQFASIHPSAPELLSSSKSIEEFKERLHTIYSEVRGGEISFEGKIPPANTGEIEWSVKRGFDWREDEEKLGTGFPRTAVSIIYAEGSPLTSSLYASR